MAHTAITIMALLGEGKFVLINIKEDMIYIFAQIQILLIRHIVLWGILMLLNKGEATEMLRLNHF
jgi:hypothetical protein